MRPRGVTDSVEAFGAYGEGSIPSGGIKLVIKKMKMKNLLIAVISGSLILPLFSLAAGLVPCGGTDEDPCQLCHLFVLLDTIVDFVLFKIILPLATLLLVIGGILFIFNAENPENVTKGKAILTSVVIGLIIIFAAWLIINSFVMLIGVSEWTGLREGWFQIECP